MILKFSIPLRGKPQVVLLVLTVAHIPESHLTSSFKLEFDEKSYKAMFRGEAKGKQKTTVGGDLDSTFQTLLPVNLLEIWLKCRFCFSRSEVCLWLLSFLTDHKLFCRLWSWQCSGCLLDYRRSGTTLGGFYQYLHDNRCILQCERHIRWISKVLNTKCTWE